MVLANCFEMVYSILDHVGTTKLFIGVTTQHKHVDWTLWRDLIGDRLRAARLHGSLVTRYNQGALIGHMQLTRDHLVQQTHGLKLRVIVGLKPADHWA